MQALAAKIFFLTCPRCLPTYASEAWLTYLCQNATLLCLNLATLDDYMECCAQAPPPALLASSSSSRAGRHFCRTLPWRESGAKEPEGRIQSLRSSHQGAEVIDARGETCTRTYIYIYVYIYICTYVHICVYVCARIRTCARPCVGMRLYV